MNLWGCHNVTDASLMALADHMHTLQELNLRYCHRLTDRCGSRRPSKPSFFSESSGFDLRRLGLILV